MYFFLCTRVLRKGSFSISVLHVVFQQWLDLFMSETWVRLNYNTQFLACML